MPQLKHAISGATYSLEPNGLVKVEIMAQWAGSLAVAAIEVGEIRQVDPHMVSG